MAKPFKISNNTKRITLINLIFAALFLGVAAIMIFGSLSDTPENLYKRGQIFDPGRPSDEVVAVAVHNVIPLGIEDAGNVYYAIEYSPAGSQVVVEVPMNDKTFDAMVSNASDLKTKPKYIKVKVTPSAQLSTNFTATVDAINAEYGLQIAAHSFLSVTESKDDNKGLYIGAAIFTALGLFFVGNLFWSYRAIKRNEAELFETYPELQGNLDNLRNAGYTDEELRVFVYGNHLISLFNGFHMIDLRQVTDMHTYILNTYHNFVKNTQVFIQMKLENGKTRRLPVRRYKKETEFRLQALYDYLESR